jgi:hypothetical protein
MQQIFIKAAKTRLARRMGPWYAKGVQACLSEDFAKSLDQTESGLGTIIGVIEHLNPDLLKLRVE